MHHINIAQMIFNAPLMVEERKKNVITEYFLNRMAGGPQAALDDDDRKESRKYHRMGNVAIIPVTGTLVHRQRGMEAFSGMTSYQSLAAMVDHALNDAAVDRIFLDIDSGGGQVAGLFDLVSMLEEAKKEKPIWAFANESAFSAAYAIASAADRLFVSRTSGVGSIGVVMQHIDFSRLNEAAGITVTAIFAGERKMDFSSDFPLTKEAYEAAKKEVDDTYDLFVETVARNRGMTEAAVRSTEAGLFFGQNAVKMKLADEVSSFDQALGTFLQYGNKELISPLEKGNDEMKLFGKLAQTKPTSVAVEDPEKEDLEDTVPPEEVEDEEPEAPEDEAAAEKPEDDAAEDEKEPEAEEDEEDPEAEEDDKEKDASAVADPAFIAQAAVNAGLPELAPKLIRKKATYGEVRERLDASKEIGRVCALAGVPSRAQEFVSKNLSVSAVKDILLEDLAKRTEASDVSTLPDPSAVTDSLKQAEDTKNLLMADAERRRKEWETRKDKGAKR